MVLNFPILDLLQDSCDPPLTADTLEQLQAKLGRRFPQEYADFLLHFNGGHFVRTVLFDLPNPRPFVSGGLIKLFFGEPNVGYELSGLVKNAEWLSEWVPAEYMGIAHCNFNDQVLLKLVGPDSRFEGVWFWDSSACVEDGEPLVHWVANSFNEFLEMLVHDICAYEEERETLPLFQSVQRGAITAIEQYLAQGGDVNARNEHGHTLLMAAAIYRWPKLVKLLLDQNADPNSRDNLARTPLHHASVHSLDSVKLILKAGGDAKARDQAGKSVLGAWCYRADQILRAHGATE
jgi:hypothetical protein